MRKHGGINSVGLTNLYMKELIFGFSGVPVLINSQRTLIAALVVGVIGPAVFVLQPGFVQGMVQYKNFTEKQSGYIASAEMWGIAATAFVMIFLASRFNWRCIIAGSIALIALANIASIFTDSVGFFAAWRFVVGLGSGALVSLSFTVIGLTKNADRNFAYLIMLLLSYGAFGLLIMPSAYNLVGLNGVILFFALFALVALPLLRYIPVSGESHVNPDSDSLNLPPLYKIMAVGAMLFYFIGQGAVWAYLFLIGVGGGVGEQQVANSLTLSQVLGAAGALSVVLVGIRFGRLLPISVGIFGGVLSLVLLIGKIDFVIYAVAVGLFNFAWNMTHPYLMASLANFDSRGRLVVYGVAGQMFGLAIGPAIAAYSIQGTNYDIVSWLGIVFFVGAFLLIMPPIIKIYNQAVCSGQAQPDARTSDRQIDFI